MTNTGVATANTGYYVQGFDLRGDPPHSELVPAGVHHFPPHLGLVQMADEAQRWARGKSFEAYQLRRCLHGHDKRVGCVIFTEATEATNA